MEYYKVYCQQHPYEFISNFCCDPGCLVGLCATCICEHTAAHIARGTAPRYQNVKGTFSRFNELMREQIDAIEQDKEWLNGVCQTIADKKREVRATLRRAREDCLALVGRHFDELEGRIDSQINNESKKNSLHSNYRLETLNSLILKEVSSLLMYSKDLNSSKFLQTAKLVEEEVLPCSRDFHLRVSKELKENEVYSANAIYRSQLLGEVGASLGRLINLQFLLPTVEYVQGGRAVEERRASSVGRSASAVLMVPRQELVANRLKNNSAFIPKPAQSFLMSNNSSPLQQIQQQLMRSSEGGSPLLAKGSRLGSGLKIIRESKRESVGNDESRSMTSSSVSYGGKENLAYSTFYDSGSSFYK